MDTDQSVFKFGRITNYLLLGCVFLSCLEIISQILELNLLKDIANNKFESHDLILKAADDNDMRQQVIGYMVIAANIITIVFFSLWIYNAHRNVRALGARNLSISPGWAIGWFIVPIANLWKPYQAMSELWRASKNPLNWQNTEADWIIPIWWGFWLFNAAFAQSSVRLTLRAETIDQMTIAGTISMASAVFYIPSCLIAINMINQIAKFQLSQSGSIQPSLEPQPSESEADVPLGPAPT